MRALLTVLVLVAACSPEAPVPDGGGGGGGGGAGGGGGGGGSGGSGGGSDSGPPLDAGVPDAGRSADAGRGPTDGGAARWILEHFADAGLRTGNFTSRTTVETPALVRDATACCAKYAFDVRETVAPDDRQVGFVNVTIKDLVSADAFGGGVQTSGADGVTSFFANVLVEPNWPNWVSYATTNKDGLVLDGSAAIYGEDLTIRNWNADAAIDNKADRSQFVRLRLEGRGHRGIRYWTSGPHYLVESTLQNTGGLGEGSLLWFANCTGAVVNIYASTFNGSPTVPAAMVACDSGSAPRLNYLTVDPRTTGELHPMFSR